MLRWLLQLLLTAMLGVMLGAGGMVTALAQGATVELPDNPPPTAEATTAAAQEDATTELEGRKVVTNNPAAPVAYITFKTPFEEVLVVMTVATLGVTLIALIVMEWRSGISPEFNRAFIVVVIIFAALFLIAAGYSNEQAAPAYGLLGTIAGYVLGKSHKKPVQDAATATADKAEEVAQ
jgi:hypothetical protein